MREPNKHPLSVGFVRNRPKLSLARVSKQVDLSNTCKHKHRFFGEELRDVQTVNPAGKTIEER